MSEAPYQKVSTLWQSYFDYSVGSLVQADFTVEIDKNGVSQAVAGFTITYIAGNRYYVAADATTGFPAATGTYNVTIYRTSDPLSRWTAVVRVTNDGTPSGTTGTTAFNSATNDGRVTDGSNPLQNVTIRISRPSGGGFYTSVQTTSDGNWGPVYLDTDGVWTFTAQISGYSVGSGSITVSSGIPTGPGADIALSVVAASSSITLSSLQAYARRMYRDRTGSKADTELTQVVNDALTMITTEHDWPWYQTVGSVTFRAAYQTGTVALTNGSKTVTLSGGTFPYTTVGITGPAELYINGLYRRIASMLASSLTLVDTWDEANYSGIYQVAQIEYACPTDLMKLEKITSVNTWVWGPNPTSRFNIEEARQFWSIAATNPPRMWAIERDRLVIWPPSNVDKQVNLLYQRRPAELSGPTDLADWDPNLIELLRRSIDYQVSCRGDCVAGNKSECFNSYRECIARYVSQDKTSPNKRLGLLTNQYDDMRSYGVTITR